MVDLTVPKKAQATRGRPKGALNKEKTTKREPSSFQHIQNKRKAEEKAEQKNKKQKLEDNNAAQKSKKEAPKIQKEDLPAKNPKKKEEGVKSNKLDTPEKKKEDPQAQKKRVLPVRNLQTRTSARNTKKDEDKPKIDGDESATLLPPVPPSTSNIKEKATSNNKQKEQEQKKKEEDPPHNPSYIKKLPTIIQDHVAKALDMDSDGHCGFQAVLWSLGRGQGDYMNIRAEIIKEITDRRPWYEKQALFHSINTALARLTTKGPQRCGKDKWMSMPSVGEAMANAFSVPVFFFSESWSQTFLPFFSPPPTIIHPSS